MAVGRTQIILIGSCGSGSLAGVVGGVVIMRPAIWGLLFSWNVGLLSSEQRGGLYVCCFSGGKRCYCVRQQEDGGECE